MGGQDWLAERFEENRTPLRAVAYRAGVVAAAEPLGHQRRREPGRVPDAVASRVCLDMLRSRRSRREEPLDADLPDPVGSADGADPEAEALLADSVGPAPLVPPMASCSGPTVQLCRPARRRRFRRSGRGDHLSGRARAARAALVNGFREPCGLRAGGHGSCSASRSRAGRSSPSRVLADPDRLHELDLVVLDADEPIT
jgi:hypothetical protein